MLFHSVKKLAVEQDREMVTDGIEVRVDLLEEVDIEEIAAFVRTSALPVMLTLRKATQGGGFHGTESEREELIHRLLALEPQFFDLEWDVRNDFLRTLFAQYPQIQWILSHHDCTGFPPNLSDLYSSMQGHGVFTYKIAVMTDSANQVMKMLRFVKTHPKTSGVCMGKIGEFGRVLAPIMGNIVNFASMAREQETAIGQLTADQLCNIYHYRHLNQESAIYGLIGAPIEESIGHHYHNQMFRKMGINAVYVKIPLKAEELADFILLAKEIGIRGLSVTAPLKEAIVPFLDEVDCMTQSIGAVNTLIFSSGKVKGVNTDGMGALDAIEKRSSVPRRKVVLIGAGGAARAIAFEARRRGAAVLVLNRTVQRAHRLAEEIGCEFGSLDAVPSQYDILIKCSSEPMPIEEINIHRGTIVMDIVYGAKATPFLEAAQAKECRLIYGEEMFLNQAARQLALWIYGGLHVPSEKNFNAN